MKQLIVNADDLGLSPAVNCAILRGAVRGAITAASLMVNMPFAEEAAAQVQATCPNLSVALHFCLTSGQALLPPQTIPALVDAQGRFKLGFTGLWRALTSKKTRTDILAQATAEFYAQLERMDRLTTKYSLRFDHLDSHQHVHVLPGLLELLDNEAGKRHLVLRIPHEPFGDCRRVLRRFASWFPGGLARKTILDRLLRSTEQEQKVGYFGILDTGQVGPAAFREIVRVIRRDPSKRQIFELNIHPAFCEEGHCVKNDERTYCSQGDIAFQRSPWRKKELELATSSELTTLLEKNHIALVAFDSAVTP